MNILIRISNYIAKLSKFLATLFISALTIVLVAQVLMRVFFSSGIPWAVELATFSVIWAVMLTANILIVDNELISVDFLDHLFSENFKRIRNILYQVAFIILLLIITYFGWKQAIGSFHKTTASLGISWFYPYLAIPIGSFFMLYQYVLQIILNILNSKEAS